MITRCIALLLLAACGAALVWIGRGSIVVPAPRTVRASGDAASQAPGPAFPAAERGSNGDGREAGAPVTRGASTSAALAEPQSSVAPRVATASTGNPAVVGQIEFTSPAESGSGGTEPIVSEPLARNALRLVGKDPAAEAIWERAINDAGLPQGARKDLIEDLNDEGFPDHRDLTAADIPLILARLRAIERLAPSAMDEVNAAAFAEAYKDLLAMLARLRGSTAR